jgi:signal peptidase I
MSIIIAFALAFVFRGFVVEAFVIPTGSMGPTLMGQHMRFRDPASGYEWAVGPWQDSGGGSGNYPAVQKNISVHDPMSGAVRVRSDVPLSSGDRILVLKYLYAVFEPRRYDVVVFKNPSVPQGRIASGPADNYIKRLIGLPGEHIALVDGDVFVRAATSEELGSPRTDPMTYWTEPGWKIARKGVVQQRALWQPVFDSSYAPEGESSFQPPWKGSAGWSFANPRVYEFAGAGPASLVWDSTRLRYPARATSDQPGATWAITDRYAYDEVPPRMGGWQNDQFPVSDLRLRAGIEAIGPGLTATANIAARSHEFTLEITGTSATLKMREPVGPAGVMTLKTLGTATITALEPGKVTNVEFWHSDQTLRVFINDKQVMEPVELDWTPAQRLLYATKKDLKSILGDLRGNTNPLSATSLYVQPQVSWTFAGAGVRLYRVGLDRDLHYRADWARSLSAPALGTSPFSPLILKQDQFFCCGDNSPQSLDGRLWGYPEPWVEHEFGRYAGVVPRDLMLGRAFFVYWPSLLKEHGPIPMADFGRMRFIW